VDGVGVGAPQVLTCNAVGAQRREQVGQTLSARRCRSDAVGQTLSVRRCRPDAVGQTLSARRCRPDAVVPKHTSRSSTTATTWHHVAPGAGGGYGVLGGLRLGTYGVND